MKRTSSMKYETSDAARELYLVANNDYRVYPMLQAVSENLKRKRKKGIYDSEKAIDAWYHVMAQVSGLYFLDYGYHFTVTERFTAAVDMRDAWELDN